MIFLKHTIALLMSIVILSTPSSGLAGDFLDKMLGSWLTDARSTGTKAGLYKSQERNFLSGGRFAFRPRTDMDPLIQYSPPSFRKGCSGIDIALGAFSFIKFDKLVNKIKNAGTSFFFGFAVGMAYTIPTVHNTLNMIQTAVDLANRMSQGACQAGMQLGKKAGESMKEKLSSYMQGDKTQSDAAAGADTAQQGITALAAALGKGSEVNLTWSALQQVAPASMSTQTLNEIMSALGSIVVKIDKQANEGKGELYVNPVPALYTNAELLLNPVDQLDSYVCTDFGDCLDIGTVKVQSSGMGPVIGVWLIGLQGVIAEDSQVNAGATDLQQNGASLLEKRRNQEVWNAQDIALLNAVSIPILPLMKWVVTMNDPETENHIVYKYARIIASDILIKILNQTATDLRVLVKNDKTHLLQDEIIWQFLDELDKNVHRMTQELRHNIPEEPPIHGIVREIDQLQGAMDAKVNSQLRVFNLAKRK